MPGCASSGEDDAPLAPVVAARQPRRRAAAAKVKYTFDESDGDGDGNDDDGDANYSMDTGGAGGASSDDDDDDDDAAADDDDVLGKPKQKASSAQSKKRKRKLAGVGGSAAATTPTPPTAKTSKKRGGSDERDADAPMKKKLKLTKDGHLWLTVWLSGARAGDILEGCADDTAGVVVRIVRGVISSPTSFHQRMDRDEIVNAIAKHFGLSKAKAELRYNDIPQKAKTAGGHDRPNHVALGGNCQHSWSLSLKEECTASVHSQTACKPDATFVLLQPGKFQEFADDAGHGAVLNQWVAEQKELCWRDILSLVGKKQLILRPRLFHITSGPRLVEDPRAGAPGGSSPLPVIDAATLDKKGAPVHYAFDESFGNTVIKLPACGPHLERGEVVDVVCAALGEDSRPQAAAAFNLLSRMTGGGLKSSLQKTVRFHSRFTVLLPDVPGHTLDRVGSNVFAATALALLFADKGSFSPELQLYTRGCAAALKRLAVILVEDVWFDHPKVEQAIRSLLGMSLACQRISSYYPSRKAVIKAVGLAAGAVEAPSIVMWRAATAVPGSAPAGRRVNRAATSDSAQALADSAKLLRAIRSFDCDMKMMDAVATMARKSKALRVYTIDESARPKKMPCWHLLDQHFVRGIGHLLAPDVAPTFEARFKRVFHEVTGVNPRLQALTGFEKQALVKEVRFAQKQMLPFALGLPLRLLDAAGAAKAPDGAANAKPFQAKLPLDSGTFSAAVGPLRVKLSGSGSGAKKKAKPSAAAAARNILVILGVDAPEDEITMLPPSRNVKDLYGGVGPEQHTEAVAAARGMKLAVNSPLIAKATATFEGDSWCLDGRPWSEYVQEGIQLNTPLHVEPAWCTEHTLDATLLANNAVIKACMTETGTGVCANAQRVLGALLPNLPQPIVLRARSLLRQQYVSIQMPTPSLSGGLGSDQLMAYANDWSVYRLLLIIARLVPGALEPQQVPNFKIKNAALLRLVEQWMLAIAKDGGGSGGARCSAPDGGGVRAAAAAAEEAPNAWAADERWQRVGERCGRQLMEHQSDGVSRMLERDEKRGVPGHFLVMDTGLGKTITAICYLHKRLTATPMGRQVKYILWLTPKSTVPGLIRQLKTERMCPTHHIEKVGVKLKPYHINVVDSSNLLRKLILKDLPSKAPACAVVFDEVDTMYEATARTSAARRIAQLCPIFVAQTATPMVKKVEHLVSWLQNTEQYPVHQKNFLVAASGMVSTQISLGITAIDNLVKVPLSDAVRVAHRKYNADRDWLSLARRTQQATDLAMCQHAAKLAVADRKSNATGGVLLVANDGLHAERLIELMSKPSFSGPAKFSFLVGGFEDMINSKYGCIVVPKSKDRGYNSASRLGAMVKGAYAGNGNSRHQMRGRIRRLGQKRSTVTYATVVMEHTMLELLDERQKGVDSVNISLEALAKKFDAVILDVLDR